MLNEGKVLNLSKVLVLYYSFEGNTKMVAEIIADSLEADIKEIKPVKEIESKGFSKYLWGGRQVLMGKKPEIEPLNLDFSIYDIILIGSPIWAGSYAPPIKTVLESDCIKAKKIGYFFCHQGGAGKSGEKTKKEIEKNNIFISGVEFVNAKSNHQITKEKAVQWAKEIEKIIHN